METSFPFLNDDDKRLLESRMQIARYEENAPMLLEGATEGDLFLVTCGTARVERSDSGAGIAFRQLGEGEVFNEASFLEGVPSTTSVIASDDVEVAVWHGSDLEHLVREEPAFGVRFYQALAKLLSERLRYAASLAPPVLLDGLPGDKRTRLTKSTPMGKNRLPDDAVGVVEGFKASLLSIDRGIKEGQLNRDEAQEQVNHALFNLVSTWVRLSGEAAEPSDAIGAYVFRETFPFFMQSRFCERSFSKPRGYPGDYGTIELIYRNEPGGDGRLGPFIDSWILSQVSPRAVRNRRAVMVDIVRRCLAAWRKRDAMPVVSLASGPAREVFDVLASPNAPNIHVTCIDIDQEALSYASEKARQLGVEGRITFLQENLVRVSQGRSRMALRPQQLAYSLGLIDYFEPDIVVTLLDWIYDLLLPGGWAVLGNFGVDSPDRHVMDYILEWPLIYRSEEELRALFARSKFEKSPVRFQQDSTGLQIIAECQKPT